MPTESTQQPFTGDQPRSTADTELVSEVLGGKTADEMTELAGETTDNPRSDTPSAHFEITDTEQEAVDELERIYTLGERRQQYLKWAKGFGVGEDWVERNFDFQDNGDVHTKQSLNFYNLKPKMLPPGLTFVNGHLHISSLEIKIDLSPLKNIKIQETLYIDSSDIDKIPAGIECGRIMISYDGQEETDSECRKKGEELRKLGYTKIHYTAF